MVKPIVLVHKASLFDVHVLVGEAALVSDGVGQSLLSVAQNHIPDISSASLLRLELVNFPNLPQQIRSEINLNPNLHPAAIPAFTFAVISMN